MCRGQHRRRPTPSPPRGFRKLACCWRPRRRGPDEDARAGPPPPASSADCGPADTGGSTSTTVHNARSSKELAAAAYSAAADQALAAAAAGGRGEKAAAGTLQRAADGLHPEKKGVQGTSGADEPAPRPEPAEEEELQGSTRLCQIGDLLEGFSDLALIGEGATGAVCKGAWRAGHIPFLTHTGAEGWGREAGGPLGSAHECAHGCDHARPWMEAEQRPHR